MGRKCISEEQKEQILSLNDEGIGRTEISKRTGISRTTIRSVLGRIAEHRIVEYFACCRLCPSGTVHFFRDCYEEHKQELGVCDVCKAEFDMGSFTRLEIDEHYLKNDIKK